MADKTDWIVDGFQFGTEKDAELAKNEQERIERLEEKLDYENQDMVNAVYQKAINNRVFRTPVGYVFLKKLQQILQENNDTPANIPVYGVYSMRESANPTVERVIASRKPAKQKNKQEFFSRRTSIFVNIILVFLLIAVVAVSTIGSAPTVFNYENILQNRYAQWEQQLSEREQIIREKEKELLETDKK